MTHELIKLPYAVDALAPVISQETIELHHGKHLQTYVNNLNNLIRGTEFENMSLEDIVKKSEDGIFNNAGQVLNHNLYFTQFAPRNEALTAPKGLLLAAIEQEWGSFEGFMEKISTAANTLFGSGWAWLSAKEDGKLVITREANGSNPIKNGLKPIFGIDVWEHSYYLSYQNRRADHVKDLWSIINWHEVEARY